MNYLLDIQQKLKAPKGQFNKFGKYNYRNCEDILEALKEPLKSVECYVTLSDDIKVVADRIYVQATVSLKKDGKVIESVTAYARESLVKKGMDESQITGAASSYARKYALNGLFAIDDTKDADSSDNTKNTEKEPSISKEQYDRLAVYCVGMGENGAVWTPTGLAMMKAYGISDLQSLPSSKFNDALVRAENHANNS